jgi:hypothetical protein
MAPGETALAEKRAESARSIRGRNARRVDVLRTTPRTTPMGGWLDKGRGPRGRARDARGGGRTSARLIVLDDPPAAHSRMIVDDGRAGEAR